ncbi:MAG: helix-turn-helix transcriptional regulator [Bacteroidia bacterium]|nr:helix-turn-helix transcriptional regulator [Bacteroidia bacterium]
MSKTEKQLKLICGRIRNLREIKGFSQEYMAHKLNMSVSAYSRIERSEVYLTIEKLLQIRDLFGVDLKTILDGENAPTSQIVQEEDVKDSELFDAYRQQIQMLKEQVDYLKSIIDKKK